MDKTEIVDKILGIKPRTAFAILAGSIIGTNSFTIIHQRTIRTEQTQTYNKERADRISERMLEEAKDYYHLQELKQELKNCKDENNSYSKKLGR